MPLNGPTPSRRQTWIVPQFKARKRSSALATNVLRLGAYPVQRSRLIGGCSLMNALCAVQSRSQAVQFGLRGRSVSGYDDFTEIGDLDIRAVVL